MKRLLLGLVAISGMFAKESILKRPGIPFEQLGGRPMVINRFVYAGMHIGDPCVGMSFRQGSFLKGDEAYFLQGTLEVGISPAIILGYLMPSHVSSSFSMLLPVYKGNPRGFYWGLGSQVVFSFHDSESRQRLRLDPLVLLGKEFDFGMIEIGGSMVPLTMMGDRRPMINIVRLGFNL